jgi:hypothetical protein
VPLDPFGPREAFAAGWLRSNGDPVNGRAGFWANRCGRKVRYVRSRMLVPGEVRISIKTVSLDCMAVPVAGVAGEVGGL